MLVLHAVFVHAHVAKLIGIGNAIPDEIETAFARPQIVVEAGDRVGDHLLTLGQIEREQRIDAVRSVSGARSASFGAPRQM